jgi:small subunit ribosomal protein S17
MRHPKYQKVIERSSKYYAHDESNALEVGQKVRLMETRPLSKLKRWRVIEAL